MHMIKLLQLTTENIKKKANLKKMKKYYNSYINSTKLRRTVRSSVSVPVVSSVVVFSVSMSS